MTVMTGEALPPAYHLGKVITRVVRAVGGDISLVPSVKGAVGTVTFTPKITERTVYDTTSEPAVRVLHSPIVCALDASGYLVGEAGRGVWLWTGQWTVSFSNSLRKRPFEILVTESHTDATPLDLWEQQPYVPDPTPGVPTTTMLVPMAPIDGYGLIWSSATASLVWGKAGAVDSVNGKTGVVVLMPADIGAQPAGSYVSTVNGTGPDLTGNVVLGDTVVDAGNGTLTVLDGLVAAPVTQDATTTVKGVLQLAGDLGGTAAAPTVPGLAGKAATVHTHPLSDLAQSAATTGQVATWSGTAWTPSTPAASAGDATTTTKGIVQLAGDLAGTAAAPTVPGLAGKVDTADPRLSDARTPTPHASSHTKGAVDQLTVASLAAGSTDTTKVLAPDGLGGLTYITPPTGGGPAPTGFNPVSEMGASLYSWHRADLGTTLDSSTSDQRVTAWADQSGNGRAFNATLARAPRLIAHKHATRGDLPGLQASGSSRMTSAIVPATGAGARTIISVIGFVGGGTTAFEWAYAYGSTAGGTGYGLATRMNSVTRLGGSLFGTGNDYLLGPVITRPIMVVAQRYSGTAEYLNVNGWIGEGFTRTAATSSTAGLALFGLMDGAAEMSNLTLYEIATWSRALSDTEVATAADRLMAYYGIA